MTRPAPPRTIAIIVSRSRRGERPGRCDGGWAIASPRPRGQRAGWRAPGRARPSGVVPAPARRRFPGKWPPMASLRSGTGVYRRAGAVGPEPSAESLARTDRSAPRIRCQSRKFPWIPMWRVTRRGLPLDATRTGRRRRRAPMRRARRKWRRSSSARSASSMATSAPARSMRCASRSPTPNPAASVEDVVIGTISLLIFALILTVTAKYVFFLMRADNRGEGGILSLMALAQKRSAGARRPSSCPGVAGAALFSATHHHPGDLGAVGGRGPEDRQPAISANMSFPSPWPFSSRCSGCRAMARRASPLFRPGDGDLLPRDRRARRRAYRRCAAGPARFRSAPRLRLSADPWLDRLRRARLGLPRRHRRGGALRRHGPFRPRADPDRLDVLRAAGAGAQLSRPGRADSAPIHKRSKIPSSCWRPNGRCCRSSFSRRWRPSSPARRSSPAHSPSSVRPFSSACCRASRSPTPRRPRRARSTCRVNRLLLIGVLVLVTSKLERAGLRLWHRRDRHDGGRRRRSPSSWCGANGAGRYGRRRCSSWPSSWSISPSSRPIS